MILLDTDHLTVHAFPESRAYGALSAKIRNASDEFGTTIVCLEEQLRGWLAAIVGAGAHPSGVNSPIAKQNDLRKIGMHRLNERFVGRYTG